MFSKIKVMVLAFLAISALSLPAFAQTTISSCETITQPGKYAVQSQATLHSTGDCLVIAAPSVTIQTQVATITGNGTGAGIHIMPSAINFQLLPFATTINTFSVGIQDDANNAYIGSDYGDPLWIGDQVSTGVLLNNVVGSQVNGVGTHAIWNGILIHGGHNNLITGYETQILSDGNNPATNPTECCFEVIVSGSDGIRIENGSYGNMIYQALVSKGGSDGADIHVTGNSSLTFIAESEAGNSGTGIRIESGASNNSTVKNDVKSNTLDLFDGNSNCGSDIWLSDTFNTSSPSSCVH